MAASPLPPARAGRPPPAQAGRPASSRPSAWGRRPTRDPCLADGPSLTLVEDAAEAPAPWTDRRFPACIARAGSLELGLQAFEQFLGLRRQQALRATICRHIPSLRSDP